MVQVSDNTLKQVEKCKYLGLVFTCDGGWSKEVDARIAKANAVLRKLYRSVVIKWELSNTANCQFFYRSLFRSLSMFLNLG